MKTFINKLAIVIIPLMVIFATVTVSNAIARKVELAQAAAMVNTQPGPQLLGNSISSALNALFTN